MTPREQVAATQDIEAAGRYETLLLTAADGVAVLTLNRPERLNAYTTVMARELVAAFDLLDGDDEVRAIVVTGAGRGFCAGADLAAGASAFDASDDGRAQERAEFGKIGGVLRDRGGVASLAVARCRKPVIAAINGPAVGIGVTLTLPMDVRIAGESARFGLAFARRGLVPEAASSWFLPRVVGISQAMEWCMTGRVFDAREALDGRLVSRIVPDGELMKVALELAHECADNTSAVSVAVTRQLLWSMLGSPTPWDAHRLDSNAIHTLGQGPDAAEGVLSFLEKRSAEFGQTVPRDYPNIVPPWPPMPDDVAMPDHGGAHTERKSGHA